MRRGITVFMVYAGLIKGTQHTLQPTPGAIKRGILLFHYQRSFLGAIPQELLIKLLDFDGIRDQKVII